MPDNPKDVPAIALIPFVLVTFALTWGIIGFYVYFSDQAVSMFGEISGTHPFYMLVRLGIEQQDILILILTMRILGRCK